MERFLEKAFDTALRELGAPAGTPVKFEQPQNEQHGDLSTNVAMLLAKTLKRPPRDVAKEIIANLHLENSHVRTVEIAGPGFINITFDNRHFTDGLRDLIASGSDFGRVKVNEGKSINLEWLSANPTGNLHAGHGRQACLGQAITNLLDWTGATVIRDLISIMLVTK